ncbi:TonB-dependent receptor [Psychroflexus sp. MBR-150]
MKTKTFFSSSKEALLLYLCILFSTVSFSQNSASITGVCVDSYGKLPGVSILIKGTNYGAISNLEGNFTINNVPVGDQVVEFSFMGYETITKEIVVEENQMINLGTIKMTESGISLDAVDLKISNRPTQARAYSIQKNAPAIMNVISSDVIGKLPDRNAAEAVQRIPGVSIERDHGEGRYVSVRGAPLKWNSNLINGNRLPSSLGTSDGIGSDRSVPLDIFPSELIQFVQLSKAITPDMEGDAIGGSVNFITRTAPLKETLIVNAAGGGNNQAKDYTYNAAVTYGNKFFDDKLGIIVSGSIWDRAWGTDNYEVIYNAELEDPIQQFSLAELELRDYLGRRRTWGLNFGAEYNFDFNNKIFLRTINTSFQDDEKSRESLFDFNANSYTMRTRKAVWGTDLSGGELGGDHYLTQKLRLRWKGATYTNKFDLSNTPRVNDLVDPALLFAIFVQSDMNFGGRAADGYKYLDIDAPQGSQGDPADNIQPNPGNPISADELLLSQLLNLQQRSKETDYVGQVDFDYEVNNRLKLKFGGKARFKTRTEGAPLNIWIPGAAVGAPVQPFFLSDFDRESSFPFNGGYLSEIPGNYDNLLMPHITQGQLRDLYSENSLSELNAIRITQDENNPSSAGSYFSGDENVYAGYIMATYELTDKMTLIGGFRNEYTSIDYTGNKVIESDNADPVIEKTSESKSNNAFLPMFHVKYALNDNSNLRLAYTRTLARPDFGSLNPGVSQNSVFRTINRGNPDLKPTFSDNFDLLFEHYFDNVGFVSGGVFYKSITDDIFASTGQETIDGVIYNVTEPRNLEDGYLFGFEVGLSKRLDFLPGFLSGFGVEANYTYTDSEVNIPIFNVDENNNIVRETIKQPLQNQSEHLFNASIFYEKYGFMFRAAANFKGKNIVEFSEFGPEHNRWYDDNLTVDLSASYSFNKKLKLFMEVNNITNEPLRYFHGVEGRPEQVEYYSIRGQLGISYSIF